MGRASPTNTDQAVRFRLAGPDDKTVIFRLIRELAIVTGEVDEMSCEAEAFGKVGQGYSVLLAERKNQTLGLALYFQVFSSWWGLPGVCIGDLFVTEKERGSGLGRALLTETAKRAEQSWGAAYLTLSVEKQNLKAMGFYQSIGLSADDTYRSFKAGPEAFAALIEAPPHR